MAKLRWVVPLLAASSALAGCVSVADLKGEKSAMTQPAKPPRLMREQVLQAEWQGQSYESLVAAYGPPRVHMRIPGNRPNESVVVYGVRDNGSGCIDAFTVFHGSSRTVFNDQTVVTDYICR